MLLTSTTVNGAVSNDSNNNITMSVGNTVIANVNSSGIFFESGKKAIYTGAVLQVVQTVKTDTFSSGATSFTDITGLSVSITPSSASSKIFVFSTTPVGGNSGDQYNLRLVRDSTAIFIGNAAGSRSLAFYGIDTSAIGSTAVLPQTIVYLDSPSTTSSVTYKIQGKSNGGTTWYVNRSSDDTDASYRTRTASSIIVMEIAA